jgi:D-alanyl-lipoteichoic acid acyltransferase DltB (MBOAT superfamily)
MNTASLQFLGFAAVGACLYNLHSSVWWRQWTLLLANLLFLATFAPSIRAILPLAGFLVLGFVGIQIARTAERSRLFVPTLVLIIAAFVWLKKYAFLPSHSFLRFSYLTIGISYILFRILHVMIDAHAGHIKTKITPVTYLNYTLSFLTLVSGPIQRYGDFASTQLVPTRPGMNIFFVGEGLHRIAVGFFKIAVLSWLFSILQKQALESLPSNPLWGSKALTAASIAALYPLYLYFNFSGYTDMVVGVGRFFGFSLPENFKRPLCADSMIDLWNRWHITLSSWLKEYVFNPLLLASMRRFSSPAWEPFLAAPPLFITFFLIGVWHGQTSEFLFFGFLQGFSVSTNHLYRVFLARQLGNQRYTALRSNPFYAAVCRGFTFAWFTFTLLWFWSNWKQLSAMLGILHAPIILVAFLMIFLAAIVIQSAFAAIRKLALSLNWSHRPVLLSRYSLTVMDTALTVASLVITILLNAPTPDIVYKAF